MDAKSILVKSYIVNATHANAKQLHTIDFLNHYAKNKNANAKLIRQANKALSTNPNQKINFKLDFAADKLALNNDVQEILTHAGLKFEALA